MISLSCLTFVPLRDAAPLCPVFLYVPYNLYLFPCPFFAAALHNAPFHHAHLFNDIYFFPIARIPSYYKSLVLLD